MAFASFGTQIKPPPGNGPYCFRIHGQVFHQSGSFHPPDGMQPTYSQLYIIEGDQAVESRLCPTANENCRCDTMTQLRNGSELS